MNEILQYLKSHGEQMDVSLAIATGLPLSDVHSHLSVLAAKGEITACQTIRYENGEKIEGISCRIAGHIPFIKPTRMKSKPQFVMP